MALIHIGGKSYEIVHENRNGWNPEAFRDRYSEVLERYDYIIGDWGYSQLRLKGFFRDNHQKATKESTFSGMSDYINEYCNFGCAYFILERTQSTKKEPGDYDLDAYEPPKLESNELLDEAEAENAEGTVHDEEDEIASAAEAAVAPAQERHVRNYRDNRHRSSHRSNNESRKNDESSDGSEGRKNGDNQAETRTSGEQRGGKREQQRKNFRGNDNRGKKPFKLAASETAAASADSVRPTKKDTERP